MFSSNFLSHGTCSSLVFQFCRIRGTKKEASAYFDHLSGGGRNKPKRPKHASAYFDHLFRTTENAVKVGQSSPWPSFDSTLKCTDSACRPYQKFRKLDRDRQGLHFLISNSCLASIVHIHLFQSPPVIYVHYMVSNYETDVALHSRGRLHLPQIGGIGSSLSIGAFRNTL